MTNEHFVPLISVIIPNYNYARYLRECIDSVLAQTYPHVEIIVVDDGSKDDSVSILRTYGQKIRLICAENSGVSAARNLGIRESHGELVAFLDADDCWEPNKLEEQVKVAFADGIGLVYCGVHFVDENGNRIGESVTGQVGDCLSDIVTMHEAGAPAIGSTGLIAKECLNVVGLFDTNLSTSADWDFRRRVACHYKFAFVSQPLVSYRLHGNGMHLNIPLMERDNLHAMSKVFLDPAAQRVFHLRRRAVSKQAIILAGTHFHAANYLKAIWMVMKSTILWPPNVLYLLGFPRRYWNRTFSDQRGVRSN